MASATSPPLYPHNQQLNVLLHKFLNNPGSFFEHKIFTTLSLLMRNLTEQLQDYKGYYYSLPDHFFNVSSVHFLDHHHHNHHETDSIGHDDQHHHLHLHERLENSSSYATPDHFTAAVFTFVPYLSRVILTLLCILTATWFLNTRLLRRNRLIQYGIELVVSHLIIFPILPFVALFYIAIAIVRFGIWIHIQLFHRGKRHLVRHEDGFWAFEEFASSSSSVAVYMIQGKSDLVKIKKKVTEVVHSPVVQGRMFRRLRDFWGFAIWEDVERWDINDHVKLAKWPKSDKRSKDKDTPWSDKDVLDYFTTFQDKPISRKTPGWEVIVVPNVKLPDCPGQPGYACIFRMHHAIMDGISSANILHEILADKPFKFTIDPVEEQASKRPAKLMTFLMYFAALLVLPRTGLVNGLLHLDNKHNKYFAPGKGLKGPKHFAWSKPLKMDAVKKIKDKTKSSVMTVLLSSLGGSYRKMEEERLYKKNYCPKNKIDPIPEFYHALAPVALLPYPDRHPRNGFSGCVLPVAVGKYATSQERLQANHKEFKKLNLGTLDILGNFLLIRMVGFMPTLLQKYFESGIHAKMSLSNIPGSEEEIEIFGGDKIIEMGAWLPCKFTLGMAMGLFSYGGRCRATIVGDQTYLSKSDVESLVKNFETEIYDLGKSLGMEDNEIFLY